MLLSKKEKVKLVIKLANEGKTTRQIAQEAHVSLKTIGKILNKATGDDEGGREAYTIYCITNVYQHTTT